MSSSDLPVVQVHQTADYRVVVGPMETESLRGSLGYRVVNRATGVVEGEGCILANALKFADGLQGALDAYRDGTSDSPLGGEIH